MLDDESLQRPSNMEDRWLLIKALALQFKSSHGTLPLWFERRLPDLNDGGGVKVWMSLIWNKAARKKLKFDLWCLADSHAKIPIAASFQISIFKLVFAVWNCSFRRFVPECTAILVVCVFRRLGYDTYGSSLKTLTGPLTRITSIWLKTRMPQTTHHWNRKK